MGKKQTNGFIFSRKVYFFKIYCRFFPFLKKITKVAKPKKEICFSRFF